MRLSYQAASCGLWVNEKIITIHSLYTQEKFVGRGFASTLLKSVKKLAKRTGKTLRLWVGAFAHKTVAQGRLFSYYARHGFRVDSFIGDGPLWMTYYPKGLR